MFRKLLTAFGVGIATATSAAAAPPYSPYPDPAANEIYNLLFCDNLSSFAPKAGRKSPPQLEVLFANPPNIAALEKFAGDSSQEGRLRSLAYWRLRIAGRPVPKKILLGVIVETPLAAGLDTLAAFSEGGVRYINQSSKMAFFEGITTFRPLVENLFRASQPIVDRIGPWESARIPPPKSGNTRLTFLVSDGLYFGEGSVAQMQRDPAAFSVIQSASALLHQVVAIATNPPST